MLNKARSSSAHEAMRVDRKYLRIDEPKMLDSMHRNYLLGSIPAPPFPKEEAIRNKSLEDEGFFKKH